MKTLASIAGVLLIASLAHAGPGPAPSPGAPCGPGAPDGSAAPAAPSHPAPPESRRQKVLQALLYKHLTVRFEATPAREVFDFIETALGINIDVRYAAEGAAGGIDPELPITLEAEDAPALEVLEQVIEQCSAAEECAWQVRRGALEIGTKDRLSVPAARETRWYRVDELIFEAPKFDNAISLRLDDQYPFNGMFNPYSGGGYGGTIQFTQTQPGDTPQQRGESLIDLIVTVVEPTAWTRNGGDRAAIAYRDGVLIVSAPDFIQRKLFGYPKVPPPPAADAAAPAPAPAAAP